MAKNNRQGREAAITILINPPPLQRNEAWFRAQRRLLRACAPDAVADEWLDEYDHQNALQVEDGEEPLWATEFIQCRIEDLMEG